MKLIINKDSLVITPENPQDEAFLVDTMKFNKCGDKLGAERVDDVMTGFKNDKFSIKISKNI